MQPSNTLFPPTRRATRAEVTDRAAREIITAQRDAQRKQTARLRAARLEKEAAEAVPRASTSASKQRTKAP